MDQNNDGEEGGLPTKSTLSGEQGCQAKALSQEQHQRPESPEPRAVSMKSHHSMGVPISFTKQQTAEAQMQQRSDSPVPSCVSLKSNWSMETPLNFKEDRHCVDTKIHQHTSEVPCGQSGQQHQTDLDYIFMLLEENIVTFVKNELKRCQRILSTDHPECSEKWREDEAAVDSEEKEQMKSSREAFVKITQHFLRRMKKEELADCLQWRTSAAMCQYKLKSNFKKKFQCLFEGISRTGTPTPLNQIYTELYIKIWDLTLHTSQETRGARVKGLSAGLGLEDPHWRLDTVRLDHIGVQWLKPGLRKYACELTLDPDTAHRNLVLLEKDMVTVEEEQQQYPDHSERFQSWYQLLCRNALNARCYWEVSWKGLVSVGVAYKRIKRSGFSDDSCIGGNDSSWSLDCSDGGYSVWHNNRVKIIRKPAPSTVWNTVAVYVDWPAGTVSFYKVSHDTLSHIHTFHCTFTQPLYPAFRIRSEFTYGVVSWLSL
ncbi:E3 ubiquitin-protein ligase TRIM4-like [Morone saxatilis]|uniref:E3 ubiquitin-protein ligase TRIM4-like n=1 Tax=Morone saxatilis TaxID=34816 RepID=UPI0015E1E2BE|nr:E3 ubiquitin-protein ligase TRIM4-like [Morone saxatilis]